MLTHSLYKGDKGTYSELATSIQMLHQYLRLRIRIYNYGYAYSKTSYAHAYVHFLGASFHYANALYTPLRLPYFSWV